MPDVPVYTSARMPAARSSCHRDVGRCRVFIHGKYDDGAHGRIAYAARGECGAKAADANRNAGRRNLHTFKARHQIVVAAATDDRADANGDAIFVFDVEREFRFDDGAGVVGKRHHRRIEAHALRVIARASQRGVDLTKFGDTRLSVGTVADDTLEFAAEGAAISGARLREREHAGDRVRREVGAFGEVTRFVFTAGA
jgi:hypothetical protein